MGPVEFLVLAFPGETIGTDVVAPLDDSLIVTKRANGAVDTAELLDPDQCAAGAGGALVGGRGGRGLPRRRGGRIAASVRIPPEHITEAHRALVDVEG